MKSTIIQIIQILLKAVFVFPIRKDRVFFSAYSGKNYSCNPKYISERLLKTKGNKAQVVWAFTDPERHKDLPPSIVKVKFKSVKHLYYLLTAKVVVDNVESWSILPKRKGQYVINTWHGGGAYKGVGLNRKDTDDALDQNMLRKNQRIDLYLSSSQAFTQMTLRESFRYAGEVLECGMPRNDRLVSRHQNEESDIYKKLGLSEEFHYVLFAPTFRKDEHFTYDLNAAAVLKALKERFGGEWKMLYRAHYYLVNRNYDNQVVIDVSLVEDMQDLLLISRALITDYSSSIWDFSLMKKPCFLYVPDLTSYVEERAFYTPIEEWPYPYAEDMDGLCKLILDYDEKQCHTKIVRHHEKLVCMESGQAAEKTVALIVDKLSE